MGSTRLPVLTHEDPQFLDAIQAVVAADVSRLKQLLQENPDLVNECSASDHRSTLLHYVASNGIEDELQLAPDGIYHRIQNTNGDERGELQRAALETLECLLEAGAAPDAVCGTYGGGEYQTTLNLLVSSGHPHSAEVSEEMVRMLCGAGADPNGLNNNRSPLATALGFGHIREAHALAACGASTDNLVFMAALGDLDGVRACFDGSGGVDPGPGICELGWFNVSRDPATALHQALVFASLYNQVEIVSLCLENGADIDADPPGTHFTGTALHSATVFGAGDTLQILMEAGADPTIKDKFHKTTPQEWAHHCGQPQAERMLADYTATWESRS